MRSKLVLVFASILLTGLCAFAQSGGKAEPNRIRLAARKSTVMLTGTLSNSQEMEYVFTAKKGQTVTVKMSNTSLFDYRVFNPDVNFETEFDSSLTSTFGVPETGEYFLFVRKKMVPRPRTAKFTLVFSIK